eukprot:13191068-Ditylum_brightwellii.AAC.1
MSCPATNALYAAHTNLVLASHWVSFATASLSLRLAAPNISSQSCHDTASMLLGPAEPCILLAICITVPVVMSRSMKAS